MSRVNCTMPIASIAAILIVGGPAHAGLVPDVDISIQASDGFNQSFLAGGSHVGGEIYNYQGAAGNANFELDYDFNADADPKVPDGAFLGTGFTLVNNSLATMEFTIKMTLHLDAGAARSVDYGGSSAWTLTGVDGAFQTIDGQPIWTALIDDQPVDNLFWAPFWMTFNGAGSTSTSDDTLGSSGAASSTIGVLLRFSLSAGDSLTHTGSFGIIPAPPALALLALGGLASGRRRRRS